MSSEDAAPKGALMTMLPVPMAGNCCLSIPTDIPPTTVNQLTVQIMSGITAAVTTTGSSTPAAMGANGGALFGLPPELPRVRCSTVRVLSVGHARRRSSVFTVPSNPP